MFERYIANKKDFSAIEDGINLAHSDKITFFPKGGLDKVDVLMFDSRYVYIWSKRKHKLKKIKNSTQNLIIYRWKHNKKMKDSLYRGCGGIPEELRKDIFKILKHAHFFFCAPLTCFIKSQKKIKRAGINPFTTEESYIFTIIHEFGHHYYLLHSKIRNNSQNILKQSRGAWENRKIKLLNRLPIPDCYINELFAALCDTTISKTFNSKYYRNVKKNQLAEINKKIKKHYESYLDQIHRYAYALAPIYGKQHPEWFEDLLREV